MFKRFFNRSTNNITLAATMVAISYLVSGLLGIFRDRILASQFGASRSLDIYYSAFRVPDLIYNLLILGALSAGFIPVFTGLIKDFKNRSEGGLFSALNKPAWDLVNNLLNVLVIIVLGLCVLGILMAPAMIKVIVPGFSPSSQALTIALTRIMFLSPIFLGLSGILGGVLQSFRNFFVYSLAPIIYNIGIIIGAIYFVPLWGLRGLAWGVVLGAIMHMSIQIPSVYHLGFSYRPFINWRDKNLRRIGRMMIPRTLSLAISQINLLIVTIIASSLAAGSLAIFNFANNLQGFPVSVIGVSFAIAAFPVLSAVAGNQEKTAANFSSVARQILFFIIPATVLLIALRAQIIRVILGSGAFNWSATILTMQTLTFFALSLFAQSLWPLQTRLFYAHQDSRTPLYIGLFTILVNIVLCIILGRLMGPAGLALSFSIANILDFICLWILSWIKYGNLGQIKIVVGAIKFSLGALAAGLVVQFTKGIVWPYVDMTRFTGVLVQGLAAGFLGFIAYLLVCWILRVEEFYSFLRIMNRRLSWPKIKIGDQTEGRGI